MIRRTFSLLVGLLLGAAGIAQTPYTYTLPQLQGVNLQNWTAFTFPGTPNTTGGSTITFEWLACYQGGFGTNGVEMAIRTGTSTYINVLDYTGGTVDCSFLPRTVTISANLMQQALAYTGGTSLEGRVRVDDACQPGVGCASYNDPVIRNLTLTYTTESANFTSPDPSKCPGEVVQFTDASINAPTSHSWSFPGGTPATSTLPNPVVQYDTPGQYTVTLTVMTTDGESTITRTDFVTIHELPVASAGADQFMCEGESVQLQASGGSAYAWTPVDGLSNPNFGAPTASPEATTTYTVLVTSPQGCQANDQVMVTVVPLPTPVVDDGNGTLCPGDSLVLTASGAEFYTWSPNIFISGTSGNAVQVWPVADQSWTVTGTDQYGCMGETTVSIDVVPPATTPVITWEDMTLASTAAAGYQWYLEGVAITGATTQLWTPAANGNYTVAITDANGCTATSDVYFFGTLGMQSAAQEAVRVYPQPARGTLNVTGVLAGMPYRLFDAQGRSVLAGTFTAGTAIDVRTLPPGLHVLEVGVEGIRLPVVLE